MPALLPSTIRTRQSSTTTTVWDDINTGIPIWTVALVLVAAFCSMGLLAVCLVRHKRRRGHKQRQERGGELKLSDLHRHSSLSLTERVDENGWISTRGVGNTSVGYNPHAVSPSAATTTTTAASAGSARPGTSSTMGSSCSNTPSSTNSSSNNHNNNTSSQRSTASLPLSQPQSQATDEEGGNLPDVPPPAYTPRTDNSSSISSVAPVPPPSRPRPTLITTTAFWSRR